MSRLSVSVALLVGMLAVWVATTTNDLPYNSDSASYIDQARFVLKGEGFLSRPFSIAAIQDEPQPDRLFPPGYPAAVAAASWLSGVDPMVVAPWINRLGLLMLPLALLLCLQPAVGRPTALIVGALSAFSPGVQLNAHSALTDTYALLLVLLSTSCQLRAFQQLEDGKGFGAWAAGAGVLAALAYLTRNANIAFLAATVLVTFALAWVSDAPRAAWWRLLAAWSAACALVMLPWFLRNHFAFGNLQPYEMRPSTVGLVENVRYLLAAMWSDFSGSLSIGNAIAWSIPGLLLTIAAFSVLALLIKQTWPTQTKAQRAMLVFFLVYVAIFSIIVIAARTRYEWGVTINTRHAMQLTSFLLAIFALIATSKTMRKRSTIAAFTIPVLLIVSGRIYEQFDAEQRYSERYRLNPIIRAQILERPWGVDGQCSRSSDLAIISNWAFLYRIVCDVNAVHPETYARQPFDLDSFFDYLTDHPGIRPATVLLHPGNGILYQQLPLSGEQVAKLGNARISVIENSTQRVKLLMD